MVKYLHAVPNQFPAGPYTIDELRRLLASGRLTDNTLVCVETSDNWVKLRVLLDTGDTDGRKKEGTMNEPSRRPILSGIYDILGSLILIVAGVAFVLNLASDSPNSASIFWSIVGVVIAIFYFGIAQVIDFLGRTAHYSQKTCSLIETFFALQQIQATKQRSSTDETDEAPPLASQPVELEIDEEEQAKQMFAQARQHAQDGHKQQAVSGLQEIVKRFPHTQTAEQARRNLQKSRTPE